MIAFAFRLSLTMKFVGLNAPPDREAGFDQIDYEEFGWSMANGNGYTLADGTPTARRMPGTSLVMVPVYLLFGRSYWIARLCFCFYSAFTCVVLAWIGRSVVSERLGILAGFLLALYPNHAYYAMHFFSEAPGGLFATLATLATLIAWRDSAGRGSIALAGLAWGSAALFRPNILLVLPVLGLMVVAGCFANRKLDWKGCYRLAVMFGIILCMLLPIVIRNYGVMGLASLSTVNAPTLWGAHNHRTLTEAPGDWIPMSRLVDDQHPLDDDEVKKTKQMWEYTKDFLREHPDSIPYLTMMKVARFLSPFSESKNRTVYWVFALSWLGVVPFFVVGLWNGMRKFPIESTIIIAPFLAMFLTTLLYYGSIRFRDSAAPSYMLFAAISVLPYLQKFDKDS